MTTDISERGLENLIVWNMTGCTDLVVPPHTPTVFDAPVAGGTGWLLGDPRHYDRSLCVDLVQLRGFLELTQLKAAEALGLETDSSTRRQFLARLSGEIGKRGVINVIRKGIDHVTCPRKLIHPL